MKKGKHVISLQPTDEHSPQIFLEREISLTLEQGGYVRLSFTRDNIAGCIAGIVYSVDGAHHSFNPEIPLTITFRYWHLDHDLTDLEISAGICDFMNGGETISGCCRRLVTCAKMKFVDALARQQITLKGSIGQLEAA